MCSIVLCLYWENGSWVSVRTTWLWSWSGKNMTKWRKSNCYTNCIQHDLDFLESVTKSRVQNWGPGKNSDWGKTPFKFPFSSTTQILGVQPGFMTALDSMASRWLLLIWKGLSSFISFPPLNEESWLASCISAHFLKLPQVFSLDWIVGLRIADCPDNDYDVVW